VPDARGAHVSCTDMSVRCASLVGCGIKSCQSSSHIQLTWATEPSTIYQPPTRRMLGLSKQVLHNPVQGGKHTGYRSPKLHSQLLMLIT
jgi:hypothetical protein